MRARPHGVLRRATTPRALAWSRGCSCADHTGAMQTVLAHPVAVDCELRVTRRAVAREVAGHRLALIHANDRAVFAPGNQVVGDHRRASPRRYRHRDADA